MIRNLEVSSLFRSLVAAFAVLACAAGSAAHSQTAPPGASPSASPGETLFKTNCSMCHGADGAGSPFGKRLGAPDFRSKDVQDLSNVALSKIISDGKNNMPAFGTRFSADQINQLVEYIRHFHAPAPDAK